MDTIGVHGIICEDTWGWSELIENAMVDVGILVVAKCLYSPPHFNNTALCNWVGVTRSWLIESIRAAAVVSIDLTIPPLIIIHDNIHSLGITICCGAKLINVIIFSTEK